MTHAPSLICMLLTLCFAFTACAVDSYDVIWNSPSDSSSGSMPLGNGEVGLNVWAEKDGSVVFYIGRTDSWSEITRLLKLGGVRVKLRGVRFDDGAFRQELKLRDGQIMIDSGAKPRAAFRIWVDANRPVVHVEIDSDEPTTCEASLEDWRTKTHLIDTDEGKGGEVFSAFGLDGGPGPIQELPDTILPVQNNQLTWYHRDESSNWAATITYQHLESLMGQLHDPLVHRTFGGIIAGDDMTAKSNTQLVSSKPSRHHHIRIYTHTAQTDTPQQWVEQTQAEMRGADAVDLSQARAAHEKWWHDFWDRSWIRITGSKDAELVSQGYALQRFIDACGGRGNFPIKFNGSIFTVDATESDGRHYNADYRRWGGPFWFQNTRLPAWSMLTSGDFDLMESFFRMYRNMLPLALGRTKIYYHHDGAFFPETIYFWGTWTNRDYGWKRDGKPIGEASNPFCRWYFSGGLELLTLMLDRYAYTQDDHFLNEMLMPMADGILTFYDQHYPRDEHGKIKFEPAQSLETWHDATNPTPEIAGLQHVLDQLLKLPDNTIDSKHLAQWHRMRGELPPLPMKTENGKTRILPAERFDKKSNVENPELYAVFPYRLFGVGKPHIEIGQATYDARENRVNEGWQQDAIQAALLGRAHEAQKMVVARYSAKNPGSRFPAFWGPNYDWTPDQCHGSVANIALQRMLIQCDDDKIILLPAWPKEWNVEFKLHAPQNTTIEGSYHDGKIQKLTVTPQSRAKDIIQQPAQ